MIVSLIVLIIVGAIIGALARLFLRGNQNIGMLPTIICGIVGTLVGYWIAGLLGVAATSGIDWIRWIISIIVAMLAIVAYIAIARRGTGTTVV